MGGSFRGFSHMRELTCLRADGANLEKNVRVDDWWTRVLQDMGRGMRFGHW